MLLDIYNCNQLFFKNLKKLCFELMSDGFDNDVHIESVMIQIKNLIMGVVPISTVLHCEINEIAQGGTSKCYRSNNENDLDQFVIKEFFPKDLYDLGFLKKESIASEYDVHFWWIIDNAPTTIRNKFLMRFVRFILQEDEITKSIKENQEDRETLIKPELSFSSRGLVYKTNAFNGCTLKEKFHDLSCDTIRDIQIRLQIVRETAESIRDYCHSLGIYHGDIKPENIFYIELDKRKKQKFLIRNIDFDTWMSKEKIASGYLDFISTTPDYYFDDASHFRENADISEWLKYDVRALSNLLIYSLSGQNVETIKTNYKITHNNKLDWFDLFFYKQPDLIETPAEILYNLLSAKEDRALSGLYIFNKIKTLLFICSNRTNSSWVKHYTGISKIDINVFIDMLKEIEDLLNILIGGDSSINLNASYIRFLNINRLDDERKDLSPQSINYSKLISKRMGIDWFASVLRDEYYSNSCNNELSINRNLLPDIEWKDGDKITRIENKLDMTDSPLLRTLETCGNKSLLLTAQGGQGKTIVLRSYWLDFIIGKHNNPCFYIDLKLLNPAIIDIKSSLKNYFQIYYGYKNNLPLNDKLCLLLDGANEIRIDCKENCNITYSITQLCKSMIKANIRFVISSRWNTIEIEEDEGNRERASNSAINNRDILQCNLCELNNKQIEKEFNIESFGDRQQLVKLLRNNMMLRIFTRLGYFEEKISQNDLKAGILLDKYFAICFKTRYVKNCIPKLQALSDKDVYNILSEPIKNFEIASRLSQYNAITSFLIDNCFKQTISNFSENIFLSELANLSILIQNGDKFVWNNELYQEYFQARYLMRCLDKLNNLEFVEDINYNLIADSCYDGSKKNCYNALQYCGELSNYGNDDYCRIIKNIDVLYQTHKSVFGSHDFYEGSGSHMTSGQGNIVRISVLSGHGFPKVIDKISEGLFHNCKSLVNIDIPSYIKSIENSAFSDCKSLCSIGFSDSLLSIGYHAFSECEALENIIIPNSVITIGAGAFEGCTNLFSVALPECLTTIEANLFSSCRNLQSVTIPMATTSINERAFSYCKNISRLYIPKNVSQIGSNIVSGCDNLVSIEVDPDNFTYHSNGNCIINTLERRVIFGCSASTLPQDESINSIAKDAFCSLDNLHSIKISKYIEKIDFGAFSFCDNITDITVDVDNPKYHEAGNCLIDTENKVLVLGCCKSIIPDDGSVNVIGAYSFTCNLDEINITEGIIGIQYSAFGLSFKNIYLPESLKYIDDGAFGGCWRLENIRIPGGVEYIGRMAFSWCENLKSVDIAEGVKFIGYRAFMDCRGLTSVKLPNSLEIIGEEAFANCYNLSSIQLPEGLKAIGTAAFQECKNLRKINIHDSVSVLGSNAFYNCISLEDVKLSANVEVILDGVFFNCNIKELLIPEGVKQICTDAFWGCTNLTNISIPNSITSVDIGAFYECSNVHYNEYNDILYLGNEQNPYLVMCSVNDSLKETYILHENVKVISDFAFQDCEKLLELQIPQSVNNIGYGAFAGCRNLISISLPQGVMRIEDETFANCASLTKVEIPCSIHSIEGSAFNGCDCLEYNKYENACYIGNSENPYFALISPKDNNIESCNVNESTRIISNSAFSKCKELKSITLPAELVSIGDYAFRECKGLKNIEIPNSVKKIGGETFNGCVALKTYRYKNALYLGNTKNRKMILITLNDSQTDEFTVSTRTKFICNTAFSSCKNLKKLYLPGAVRCTQRIFEDDLRRPLFDEIFVFNSSEELDENSLATWCEVYWYRLQLNGDVIWI